MLILIDGVTEGNEFAKQYITGKSEIILTFISADYTDMAKNWYEHLKKIGIHDKALVICLDRDAYVYMQSEHIPSIFADENILAKAFKHPVVQFRFKHQIAKVLILYFLNEMYPSTDLVYTDVDMIFLKDPLPALRSELASGEYDGCVYIEKQYDDIALGHEEPCDHGGNIIFWRSGLIKEIMGCTTPLDASDPAIGIKVFEDVFEFKLKYLNSFLFTISDIWERDFIRNMIKNTVIAIHYIMAADVDFLSPAEFTSQIQRKINLMKKHGHWLVN